MKGGEEVAMNTETQNAGVLDTGAQNVGAQNVGAQGRAFATASASPASPRARGRRTHGRAYGRKHGRNFVTSIVCVLVVVLLAASTSLAWFINGKEVDMRQVNGSLEYVQPYFEGGIGTESDPYLIKTPAQLYNFAWLQYIGTFNQVDTGSGSITQVYFKLESDLDMTGITLPPIGTTTYPFVGNFDGAGKTISNLTVSSAVPESQVPDLAQGYTQDSDEIVGLFGVVGSLTMDTDPDDESAQTGSIGDYTYSSSVNRIYNINVTEVTVNATASKALVGVVAGYVNGTLSDVAVSSSRVNVTNDGTEATSYTENYSDYTTIGYCTSAYKGEATVVSTDIAEPKLTVSRESTKKAGTVGGDSISMMDLYDRLLDINSSSKAGTNFSYYTSQTITINEATGEVSVANGNTATATTGNAYNSIRSGYTYEAYPSATYGATRDTSGHYILNPTQDNRFIGLLGRPTDLSGTVTINRLLDEYKDAHYIKDGDTYLQVSSSGALSGVASVENTSKWVIENDGDTGNKKIYSIVGGTTYYLHNDNGSLTTSSSPDSTWKQEDGNILSVLDGKVYTLYFTGNVWALTPDEIYYIKDSDDLYYLSLDQSGNVCSTDTPGTSTRWAYDAADLYVTTVLNDTTYYLYIDATNQSVATSETPSHMVYEEGVGLYNVDSDSVEIGSWETIGTVDVSGDPETRYLLDVDGIDDGSTYAIVSTNPSTARILYNGNTSSTMTDQVSAGTISPRTMDETTTLKLNSNSRYTEAQQTWVAEVSGSGFTLRGVASSKYLDLSTVTTERVNLSSASGDGTVLTIAGTNAKTVSYVTSVGYVSTTIYSALTEEQCSQVAYYYKNNFGNYERVTAVYVTPGRRYDFWEITTESNPDEGYSEETRSGSPLEDVLYIYDASPVSNYLAHSANRWAQFCTTTSTSGNAIYFFKRVTDYSAGYATTEYLDRFINYANGLNESQYDADDWAYMQEKLAEANAVKSNIHTSSVDIAIARREQNQVNTAAANLQYALLLLNASRYFVAFGDSLDEGWIAVSSADAAEADLATMELHSTTIEAAGSVQMATTTTQGVGLPTYMPLTVPEKEDGRSTWTFEADSANTGYISSANTAGDYQAYSGDIRVAYWPMTSLEASFLNSSGRTTLVNDTYTQGTTKMQVLTHTYLTSDSDALNRISDSYNGGTSTSGTIANYTMKTTSALGLEKYDEARDNFEETLVAGGSRVYGLHFMDAVISEDATFVAEQATINGVTYSNYEMPEACIDFTLQQRSYITFFAGTYYLNSGYENNSFFSLYQIERKSAEDCSGSAIRSIKEISLIYGNTSDATLPYVYQYSDGSYSDGNSSVPEGYQLLFNTSWIKDPTIVEKAMYYYEIPVNKGEYALGSVGDSGQTSSNKYGAYLMYLDISANKQEVRQQEVTELIADTTSTYVYPKGVQLVASGSVYTSDTDSVAASVSATSNSINAYLLRDGETDTVSAINCTNAVFVGEGLSVKDASGTLLDVEPASETEKKTYSITDYAHNVTEDVWKILRKEVTQETDANGRVTTIKKYLVDGVETSLPDGETIPDIPTTSETAIAYHYTLPTGATVTTTNALTNLDSATGFDALLSLDDYPAIGADPIDKSSLITSCTVDITTTSELDLYLDQIKTGYKVLVNGEEFTILSPTKKKTIQP